MYFWRKLLATEYYHTKEWQGKTKKEWDSANQTPVQQTHWSSIQDSPRVLIKEHSQFFHTLSWKLGKDHLICVFFILCQQAFALFVLFLESTINAFTQDKMAKRSEKSLFSGDTKGRNCGFQVPKTTDISSCGSPTIPALSLSSKTSNVFPFIC